LEHRLRGQKTVDRVRLLRLLKNGAERSLKDGAPVIDYSLIQVSQWWEGYRLEGLARLLKQLKPVRQTSRLTPEIWAGLLQAMRVGAIATF
jgi:hypothetical protein